MRSLVGLVVAAVLVLAAPGAASAKFTSFTSPSKKIGCMYSSTEHFVRCDLARVDRPRPKPDSCKLDYGHAFLLGTTRRASLLCAGDTVLNPSGRVLAYGKTKRLGSFRCKVSRARGMRCTSKAGHGFELSRQRQRLW